MLSGAIVALVAAGGLAGGASAAQAAETCTANITSPGSGSVEIYDSFTYNIAASKTAGADRILQVQLADGLGLVRSSLDALVGGATLDSYTYDATTNVVSLNLADDASVVNFAMNVDQTNNSQKNSDTAYKTVLSGCGSTEVPVNTKVTGDVNYSPSKSWSVNPGSDGRTVHYTFNVSTDSWTNSSTFTSWTQKLADVLPAGVQVTSSPDWNGGAWSSSPNNDGTTTWTWARNASYGPTSTPLDQNGTNIWLDVHYPPESFPEGTKPPSNTVGLDATSYNNVDTHHATASTQAGDFSGGTQAKEIAISKLFNQQHEVDVVNGEIWKGGLDGTVQAAYINTKDDAHLASMTVEDSVPLAENSLFSDHTNQYQLNFTFNQALVSDPVPFTIEYTTNVQKDWKSYDTTGLTTASNGGKLNLVTVISGSNGAGSDNGGFTYWWDSTNRLSLPVGEHLTGWRINLSPDDATSLSNGAQVNVNMTYIASTRSVSQGPDGPTATKITNTAQATGTTVEDDPQQLQASDAATMNIEDAVPIQTSVYAPTPITVSDGGGTANFTACIANYDPSGKAYSDSTLNVVLPVGIFLDKNNEVVPQPGVSAPSGLVTPTLGDGVSVSTSTVTVDNQSHQLVTLTFDKLVSMRSLSTPWDGRFCYQLPTTVTPDAFISAGNAKVPTTSWAFTSDPSTKGLKYSQTWDNAMQDDTFGFEPAGWVKDGKIAKATATSTVNIAGALLIGKKVRASDSDAWSIDAQVQTPGAAQWQLTVLNGLDSYLTDTVVFDKLPVKGDTEGSTFDTTLSSAVTGAPDGAVVEYSKDATAADNGTWTTDPSDATAFRVKLNRLESYASFTLSFRTAVPGGLLFGDAVINKAAGNGVYHHPVNGTTDTVTFASNTAKAWVEPAPSLSIVKTTNGVHYDSAPGAHLFEGDAVQWAYVVKNTGNTVLKDVAVSDAFLDGQGASGTLTPTSTDNGPLAPGASRTFTASGAAVLGQYANTATATGTSVDDDGNPADKQPDPAVDKSWYLALETGAFSVTKALAGDGASLVAEGTVFSGTYAYPAGDGYAAGAGTWSTTAGGTWTSEDTIPVGAVVTVAEDDPAAVDGATWTGKTVSDPVTVASGETAAVTVTNTITKNEVPPTPPTPTPPTPTPPTPTPPTPTPPTSTPTPPTPTPTPTPPTPTPTPTPPTPTSTPTPPPPSASDVPPSLAITGAGVPVLLIGICAVLLVGGAVLSIISRRRRS